MGSNDHATPEFCSKSQADRIVDAIVGHIQRELNWGWSSLNEPYRDDIKRAWSRIVQRGGSP